jgi:hypothetical protein
MQLRDALLHEDLFNHPCILSRPEIIYRILENAVGWSYECPNASVFPLLRISW